MSALVAGMVLALAVPSIALAAGPATFKSLVPAAGSSSSNARPTISVTVYDPAGVSTVQSRMWVDGALINVKRTYFTFGDYKNFKVSFTPASNLTVGSHRAAVKVKNRRGVYSNTFWSWNVTAADAVAPVTTSSAVSSYVDAAAVFLFASDAGSGVDHTYFSLDEGPTQTGAVVYTAIPGDHDVAFWSVDKAGNVEVHKHATFVVASDMLTGYWHQESTPFCAQSGCHFKSLTVEHYQHDINVSVPAQGKMTCETCHQSRDERVMDAIASGSSACVDCHRFTGTTHPFAATSHAKPVVECTQAGCHNYDIAVIHTRNADGPGCGACHANPEHAASNVCADCHEGHEHIAITSSGNPSCVASSCHGTDFLAVHATCSACHASTTPAVVAAIAAGGASCETCHVSYTAVHAGATTAHTLTGACFSNPACHAFTDASLFHIATASGCRACHNGTTVLPANVNGPTFCYTCHPNLDATHAAVNNLMGPTMASRHAINGAGEIAAGVKTKFDGSQGVKLTWLSEESLVNTNSVAGNAGTYSVGQTGTVNSTWSFPTVNVFWGSSDASAPASAIKGLTKDSVITCFDCHSGSPTWYQGPHGASAKWLIDANYPGDYSYAGLTKYVTANLAYVGTDMSEPNRSNYLKPLSVSGIAMYNGGEGVLTTQTATNIKRTDGTSGATAVICAKCHDLENLIAGGVTGTDTVGTVEGSNTAHDSHHQDQNTDGSAQCVNCHVGLPHGWRAPRLLVDTDIDVAPFKDAKLMGTSRATSTGSLSNAASSTINPLTGFNGQGMQSLSGVNDHTLGGSNGTPGWQPYSTGDGTAVSTLNQAHNGVAYWDESQCQACGDHPGENGPGRIVYGD